MRGAPCKAGEGGKGKKGRRRGFPERRELRVPPSGRGDLASSSLPLQRELPGEPVATCHAKVVRLSS